LLLKHYGIHISLINMLRGIRVGSYDHRITLYVSSEVTDLLTNEITYTYSEGSKLWAMKTLKSSTERFESDQQAFNDMVTFYVRYSNYSASIKQTDIFKEGSKYYSILGIQQDNRMGWIQLDCVYRDNLEFEISEVAQSFPYTFPLTLS